MEDLDPALLALASTQDGMLSTAQLRRAGLSAPDLAHLVKTDRLLHPGRGLYAVVSLATDDPLIWHRQLVAGARLLYPDALLTGTSALLAHELPVWGAPLDVPRLVRHRDRSGGMSAFRVTRRPPHVTEDTSPWGPCVPIADAIIQHVLDNGIVPGVVSADAALHQEKIRDDDLAAAVDRAAGRPWSNKLDALLELVDGRRESVGESRGGVTLAFGGIEVIPQVTIHDHRGDIVGRVDFLIKGTKTVIEFDGKMKYKSDVGTPLYDEKKREDRLRALGYIVVRILWSDLERPAVLLAKVRRAMALAS